MLPRTTNAEVTLELDPGTFETQKLNDFQNAGFNRFSMGVQTLNENEFA
jgi:oxygen-independent coproporphyrinogen-3 oxidase